MEAWVSWLMPGTVQFIATNSDDMYSVTKQGDQFVLSRLLSVRVLQVLVEATKVKD